MDVSINGCHVKCNGIYYVRLFVDFLKLRTKFDCFGLNLLNEENRFFTRRAPSILEL